jgi:hypothetical protein
MANSIQRQWAVQASYALQTALNTPAAGTGILFPFDTGHGGMTMNPIESKEIRQDGQQSRGRHGSQRTKGSYKAEMQAYNFDDIIEAVMRGTWTGGGSLGGSILVNPTAGNLVRRYFTIEEYELDIGVSEVYQDSVWDTVTFMMKPDAMVGIDFDWVGTGQVTTTTGNAPNFSSADYKSTSAGVSIDRFASLDAVLVLSDIGQVLDLTDFTIKIDLKSVAPAVAASRFSPDVFDGVMQVSGSVKIMRRDLIPFADAVAELPITLEFTMQTPAGFPNLQQYKITIPQFTYQEAQKADWKRDGGPAEVTIPFPAAMVGIDDRGGANPPTTVIIERNF